MEAPHLTCISIWGPQKRESNRLTSSCRARCGWIRDRVEHAWCFFKQHAVFFYRWSHRVLDEKDTVRFWRSLIWPLKQEFICRTPRIHGAEKDSRRPFKSRIRRKSFILVKLCLIKVTVAITVQSCKNSWKKQNLHTLESSAKWKTTCLYRGTWSSKGPCHPLPWLFQRV